MTLILYFLVYLLLQIYFATFKYQLNLECTEAFKKMSAIILCIALIFFFTIFYCNIKQR